jgi:hypothetical protein
VLLVTLSAWTLWELSFLLDTISKSDNLVIGIGGGASKRDYLSICYHLSSEVNSSVKVKVTELRVVNFVFI